MTRFSPITAATGRRIPVLYAGRTFEVAAYESLFHAIGPDQETPTWPAMWADAHSNGSMSVNCICPLKHPAGVIIPGAPFREFTPVYRRTQIKVRQRGLHGFVFP